MNHFLTIYICFIALCFFSPLSLAKSEVSIQVRGEFYISTCQIHINDINSTEATINLGTINLSHLKNAGDTSEMQRFTITLTDCTETFDSASVYFESNDNVDDNTGRLRNTGTAENVSVEILNDETQTPVFIGNSIQYTDNPIKSQSTQIQFPFYIRLYSEGESTAGTIDTQVHFTINYQ